MNKALQLDLLNKELLRRGHVPDLTDLSALIDETLSYPENLKLILDYLNESRLKQGRKEEKALTEQAEEYAINDARQNKVKINAYDRFNQYISFIKSNNQFNAFICIGRTGTGKTTIINKLMPEAVSISGHITPKEFFITLKQNSRKTILIDDAQGLMQSKIGLELLKATITLTKDNKRIVIYDSKAMGDLFQERAILFTGKIVLLCNHIPKNSDFSAILNKAFTYYFNPTNSEVIEELLKSDKIDTEIIGFLDKNASGDRSIDFRQYHKILGLKNAFPTSWQDLGFPLINGNEREQVLFELMNSGKTVEEQVTDYKERLGKSRATFFNDKKSLKV